MKLSNAVLLLTWPRGSMGPGQHGEQETEATLPFEMTTAAATFELPWRIAFLPMDGCW